MFVKWALNTFPSWATIQAIIAGQLPTANKMLGIRLLGCGNIWRRLLTKCHLCVTGEETEIACGANQLYNDMRAVIEASIHAMCMQWDVNSTLEDQGFFLVDSKNAFNSQNRVMML